MVLKAGEFRVHNSVFFVKVIFVVLMAEVRGVQVFSSRQESMVLMVGVCVDFVTRVHGSHDNTNLVLTAIYEIIELYMC